MLFFYLESDSWCCVTFTSNIFFGRPKLNFKFHKKWFDSLLTKDSFNDPNDHWVGLDHVIKVGHSVDWYPTSLACWALTGSLNCRRAWNWLFLVKVIIFITVPNLLKIWNKEEKTHKKDLFENNECY